MSAEVDEFVDTSDLPALGVPFIAWCGARAVNLHHRDWPEDAIPPNACEDCVAAKQGVCGHPQIGPP